jgi:Leucine-rich repeat (LRR) protein
MSPRRRHPEVLLFLLAGSGCPSCGMTSAETLSRPPPPVADAAREDREQPPGTDCDLSNLDPAIDAKVREELGVGSGPISGEDRLSLESLFVLSAKSLEGIECFPSLTSLTIYRGEVHDLSPVARLVNLEGLSVSEVPVEDLTPVANLPNLRRLAVSHGPLVDVSPLREAPALESLDLNHTQVTDLSPLAGLSTLVVLTLYETPVADLSPLASVRQLERLQVDDTLVTSIEPLAGLIKLDHIHISRTLVSDLSPIQFPAPPRPGCGYIYAYDLPLDDDTVDRVIPMLCDDLDWGMHWSTVDGRGGLCGRCVGR